MNIFVINKDPVIAAKEQCDRHVVKMIVESAQMLSTAHRMLDGIMERRPSKSGSMIQYYKLDDDREGLLYKACHFNHPSTIWTRESRANYIWLYEHFTALCDEYTHRYGNVHMSDMKLRHVLKRIPDNVPNSSLTPFKLAMGSNPECMLSDPVESYRSYYKTKKTRFAMKWTKREVPSWFLQESV